ncbi:von Willebrand factor A-like domain superfamily [Babesia duncani]|uniref:von Willebrand factor A-like domain superfamily n=1 Tax=Babesia duncani TaxID=323732 RepID=A0AAD9UNX0_9APIC|nr:von Willebrand factor A-like domain superfamily [Babesia duncani]
MCERASTTLRILWSKIVDFMGSFNIHESHVPALTTAISMGLLCKSAFPFPYADLNRLSRSKCGFGNSIIIMDATSGCDYRAQYISLMNVAFAAFKHVSPTSIDFPRLRKFQ